MGGQPRENIPAQGLLEETFGDLLPVVLHGTGGHIAALTSDLFRLIGNDNLLTWPYDAPDALHQVMAYPARRPAGVLSLAGGGKVCWGSITTSYGRLGQPGFHYRAPGGRLQRAAATARPVDLDGVAGNDDDFAAHVRQILSCPIWPRSLRCFGLVYYGCCEPVHDRWDLILKAIPQVRAVSISPWCDMRIVGEMLGREIIFSRKPKPWLISGDPPDWAGLEKDLDETLEAAKDGCLEIIYRDVYSVKERSTLTRWADLVRSRVGGKRL